MIEPSWVSQAQEDRLKSCLSQRLYPHWAWGTWLYIWNKCRKERDFTFRTGTGALRTLTFPLEKLPIDASRVRCVTFLPENWPEECHFTSEIAALRSLTLPPDKGHMESDFTHGTGAWWVWLYLWYRSIALNPLLCLFEYLMPAVYFIFYFPLILIFLYV